MPIAWEELSVRMHSDHFTIANAAARLTKLKHDPWADLGSTRQSITKSMVKRLNSTA